MAYNNSYKQTIKYFIILFFLLVSPFYHAQDSIKQQKNTYPLKVKYTLLLMWISIDQK